MVTSSRDHLRNPSEELMESVVLDHPVKFTNVLQMLAHAVESLSQVFRVLLQFFSTVNHFLMEDLVAVNEIAHPTAEYWATLSHLDVHIALSSNQVRDSSGIFYFRGCLNILFELLLIFLA